MNEQQRLFFTVLLCTSIWLGWQLLFEAPPPESAVEQAQTATTDPESPTAPAASPSRDTQPASAQRGADSAQHAAAPNPSATTPAAPSSLPEDKQRAFHTERLIGTIHNGRVRFTELLLPAFAAFDHDPKAERLIAHVKGEQLVAADVGKQGIVEVVIDGQAVPLDFEDPAPSTEHIAFRGATTDGVRVSVSLSPAPDRYQISCLVNIDNQSGRAVQAALDVIFALPHAEPTGARERGKSFFSSFAQTPSLVQGLYLDGDKIHREKKLTQRTLEQSPAMRAAGLELPYFVLAWLPDGNEALSATFAPLEMAGSELGLAQTPNGVVVRASQTLGLVAAGHHRQSGGQMYVGPKRDAELLEVDARLGNVIDYDMLGVPLGFLARPMMFFMRLFFQWTHSWGVAIIMLTLLVKLLLLPPNLKSGASIRRMQALKPEIEALQKRFKHDPAKFNSEQMALYRKHQINPASGCLPVLLQIPVWLTLYRSLASAVDLYKQPFLWLTDLTATEPIPVLALSAGALTIVQQRLTPMATDSQQARVMMWVLPALVTVFMINMPAGLVLYILVNSILTLLQQVVINRRAV